jgi:hypothetical protein
MRETAIMILETAYGMKLSDREKEELMGLEINELQERLKELLGIRRRRSLTMATNTKQYLKGTWKPI